MRILTDASVQFCHNYCTMPASRLHLVSSRPGDQARFRAHEIESLFRADQQSEMCIAADYAHWVHDETGHYELDLQQSLDIGELLIRSADPETRAAAIEFLEVPFEYQVPRWHDSLRRLERTESSAEVWLAVGRSALLRELVDFPMPLWGYDQRRLQTPPSA